MESLETSTSGGLTDAVMSNHDDISPCVTSSKTPILSLGRMMKAGLACQAPDNIIQRNVFSVDFQGSLPIHIAIMAGDSSAFDFVRRHPLNELLGNGIQVHCTCLCLASLYKREAIGKAIMARFEERDWEALTNSRDHNGHPILVVAIIAFCSKDYVEDLIMHGADINPDSGKNVLSPLQAAAKLHRSDIVELLLEHDAKDLDY